MTAALTCDLCGDPIVLDDERSIQLRHSSDGDGAALAALYQRLSPEDQYLRFFTAGLPPQRWFDRWATVSERGGFGLIAIATDRGEQSVVGEAGYCLLCDGDGELGIAVDPTSRGWLGPWLLDSLLRHADDRGVPNLQALVLSGNTRMVALAKSRGIATTPSEDWTTIRLCMSTHGRTPSWPGDRTGDAPHERERLLIESDRSRWVGAEQLTREGSDILTCRGPSHQKHGCPLLNGHGCPLLDGADGVLHILDPSIPENVAVLAAQKVTHPGLRTIEAYKRTTDGEWHRKSDADLIKELQEGHGD